MLAETENQLGNKTEALRWALSALDIPNHTTEDKEAHERLVKLLKTLDSKALATWEQSAAAKQQAKLASIVAKAK
jgi:hypothetical protein